MHVAKVMFLTHKPLHPLMMTSIKGAAVATAARRRTWSLMVDGQYLCNEFLDSRKSTKSVDSL
jgi:hypothetical protein